MLPSKGVIAYTLHVSYLTLLTNDYLPGKNRYICPTPSKRLDESEKALCVQRTYTDYNFNTSLFWVTQREQLSKLSSVFPDRLVPFKIHACVR